EHALLLLRGDGVEVLALPGRLLRIVRDAQPLAAVATVEAVLDRFADARSRIGIVEPGDVVLLRAFAELRRHHHRPQRRAACGVGVLIGGDDLPFLAAGLDERDDVAGLAPRLFAARLQVRDVDGQPRLPADAQRLLDRLQHADSLVADVTGVEAAVP